MASILQPQIAKTSAENAKAKMQLVAEDIAIFLEAFYTNWMIELDGGCK